MWCFLPHSNDARKQYGGGDGVCVSMYVCVMGIECFIDLSLIHTHTHTHKNRGYVYVTGVEVSMLRWTRGI